VTVIPFPVPEQFKGNGAREALERVLDTECEIHPPDPEKDYALTLPDRLLALLWVEGYKIVPLEDGDVP
jgi:hypothetical protein